MTPRTATILALCRTVFIFTTIAAARQAPPSFLAQADWFRVANVVLFSLSNGFVATQCMMLAPKMVSGDQRKHVGLYGSLFLSLGITIGSVLMIPTSLTYNN